MFYLNFGLCQQLRPWYPQFSFLTSQLSFDLEGEILQPGGLARRNCEVGYGCTKSSNTVPFWPYWGFHSTGTLKSSLHTFIPDE